MTFTPHTHPDDLADPTGQHEVRGGTVVEPEYPCPVDCGMSYCDCEAE